MSVETPSGEHDDKKDAERLIKSATATPAARIVKYSGENGREAQEATRLDRRDARWGDHGRGKPGKK